MRIDIRDLKKNESMTEVVFSDTDVIKIQSDYKTISFEETDTGEYTPTEYSIYTKDIDNFIKALQKIKEIIATHNSVKSNKDTKHLTAGMPFTINTY